SIAITIKNAPLVGALSENSLSGYLFRAPNKSARCALILSPRAADDNAIPRFAFPGPSWGRGEARARMYSRASFSFLGLRLDNHLQRSGLNKTQTRGRQVACRALFGPLRLRGGVWRRLHSGRGQAVELEAASSQTWANCRRDMRTSVACTSRAHWKHSSAIAR